MNSGYVIFVVRSPSTARHLSVHCSEYILCEVDLPKAIELDFPQNPPIVPRMGLGDHLVAILVLRNPWIPT